MVFVDSNIPMYLVGAPHRNKLEARRLLELLVGRERLVTDVEVLQEILHRYVAIGRRDAIQPAFTALLEIVDRVYSVDVADVEAAKTLLSSAPALSARDAIHVAIMHRHGVERVLTFDQGFEGLPGVDRVQ